MSDPIVDMLDRMAAEQERGKRVGCEDYMQVMEEEEKKMAKICDCNLSTGRGHSVTCWTVHIPPVVRTGIGGFVPVDDLVNHPPHYTFGKFEVIDVIEDWGLDFHRANALKYIARAGRKSDDAVQDIKKAIFYLERFIKFQEKK